MTVLALLSEISQPACLDKSEGMLRRGERDLSLAVGQTAVSSLGDSDDRSLPCYLLCGPVKSIGLQSQNPDI